LSGLTSMGEQPYLGSRGMKCELRSSGHNVGRIHVRTLMRKMGIEALYKKPRLSKPHPAHKIYPYLLRGLDITEANPVWCSGITYIPMAKGFCYLVAIMDLASRKVLSWRVSNTLDVSFCREVLEEAIAHYATPGIFNTFRGASLRLLSLQIFSSIITSGSVWTDRAAGGTTSLSNGSGRRSNTKKCT
jgi:putative transposase